MTRATKAGSAVEVSEAEVRRMLVARIGDRTMEQAGREFGVSGSYLGDVVAGRRPVGPKVLRGLGVEWRMVLVGEVAP